MQDANVITREYFDSFVVESRLIGSVVPTTNARIFGEEFSTPVMTAALSHMHNVRENGMVELARGARMANAVNWAGMGDEAELEAIISTGARTVKIIKPYADRDMLERRIRHADECGVLALGIDIDHAFSRGGGRDNVMGYEMSPITEAELAAYVKMTDKPFVVKGVLSVRDALLCLRAGVRGIVVSHHHGILPCAAPPLMVLPDIVKAVGGFMEIFVDCAVESGYDVFKAMALGADGASLGRALTEPLRTGGARGVADYIEKATRELAGCMARTNSPTVDEIDPAVIHRIK